MKTGDFQRKVHHIVNEKVYGLANDWERYNQYQKSLKPWHTWQYLSMQSYIGSDLLIDFYGIASIADKGEDFNGEIWVRDRGTHFIKSEADKKYILDVFGKPLVRIKVEWRSDHGFNEPEVIAEGCLDLELTEEQNDAARKVDMKDFADRLAEQVHLKEFRRGRKESEAVGV